MGDRVHFSTLKLMARSPAHVRHAEMVTRETTRAMRVGTLFDRLVMGGRFAIYDGDRRGNAWQGWRTDRLGEGLTDDDLFTSSEDADARGSADSVKSDEAAALLLSARVDQREVVWSAHGLDRATRGIDMCGASLPMGWTQYDPAAQPGPWLADVKSTNSTEPTELERHLFRQLWHAQLADYCGALEAHGVVVRNAYIIAVESSPPHPVTIMRMSDELLDHGARCVALWSERYRACAASGRWPGYVQTVQIARMPEWAEDE